MSLYAQKVEPLWPNIPPGDIFGEVGEEKVEIKGVKRVSNVTEPTITYYLSNSAKATGTTVLVCPGGAYNILAIEHEGEDVCKWLNEIGVHAVLLKYRVPRRQNREPHEAPLQDAQRAMGLIREAGKNWLVPLTKLGILGFSAGGNLAVMTATSFNQRTYERIDPADDLSCRPDFAMPIYPAYLLDQGNSRKLAPHIQITKDCPPFFLYTQGMTIYLLREVCLLFLISKQSVLRGMNYMFIRQAVTDMGFAALVIQFLNGRAMQKTG